MDGWKRRVQGGVDFGQSPTGLRVWIRGVSRDLRALRRGGHENLLPKIAEQADILAVGGRGVGVAEGAGRELDPIADGNDVFGIERTDHQSLSMKVAQRVEDGIEDFARFLRIERRPAQRRGKGIVGRFEDGVEDDFAAVTGTSAIEEFDQIRVTKLASSMPEIECRGTVDDRLGHQLHDGATAIVGRRSSKKRGAVVAAQPLFQRVIPGERHAFPVFPQMSHRKILGGLI
jgi:hypothetical protein